MTESAGMPETKLPEEIAPFDVPWISGQTTTGDNMVMLDTGDLKVGEPAFVVAKCPTPEFAQYIAYMHTMLLKGSKMFDSNIEGILQGYATNTIPQPAEQPPAETGGYL